MAELEIHTEHEVDKDPVGKKVGILAAVLAVFLAIVTISSHRAHTAAILSKTNANDQWNFPSSENGATDSPPPHSEQMPPRFSDDSAAPPASPIMTQPFEKAITTLGLPPLASVLCCFAPTIWLWS